MLGRRRKAPDYEGGSESRPEGIDLDNEFDAFLAGRYAEYAARHGLPIPAWAWINRLAHATPDELDQLADRKPLRDNDGEVSAWRATVTILARKIRSRIGSDDQKLRELQRLVLVPVELTLAGEHASLRPDGVRDIVLWALDGGSGSTH